MAMWVAVSVAMKRWWQVLLAECDGKNECNRILVAKGVATLHDKKLSRKFSNFILAASEMSKFDGNFLGRKKYKHLT